MKKFSSIGLCGIFAALAVALSIAVLPVSASAQTSQPFLSQFISKTAPDLFVAGADAYGPIRDDNPVAPLLKQGELVGHVFITSDFVGTTGYSGKPIHSMVAVAPDARILGVELVKHYEPIVLIGIPDSEIKAMVEGYRGVDLIAEAAARGSAHDLNIISGATVTVMVIDDSIIRAGLKVARALGLGNLAAEVAPEHNFEVNTEAKAADSWMEMEGDGTIRRLALDVGQINAAFAAMDDPRALKRALTEPPETTFIDLQMALVSVPGIGPAILGAAEDRNLREWMKPGEHAIAVVGRGLYSFKGSGYVRGGIFDRIVLIQDDVTVRFRDRGHRRMGKIAASDAPEFVERDLFKIPADSGFDPTRPFRLQLLVHREVAAIEKVFTTFELGYLLPANFQQQIVTEPVVQAENPVVEQDAQSALWRRIWESKTLEIAVLLTMLTALTIVFFFQTFVTRSARHYFWFRMSFLTVTLVFLGWYANAQLSVVNLMALFGALVTNFSWQAFMLDPLTFILWFAVATALLFWGRGAYCGWLCPFGALQELTNRIGRALRIPQIQLPWGLHERLWPLKYMIFLGLFGVSLYSIEQAEHLAEVEPFKTAIVLKFMRAWPFVAYVAALLIAGLFVERFFCRYLCPLGAALAIPARLRMFDWLKRYHECGQPCQTCANECPVDAIHPTGEINPNECINCLHCQVLYQSETKCPVVIKKMKRRAKMAQPDPVLNAQIANHPNVKA
ncbi:MAG: 4Fe-4S binding protein [Cognatishimia sp.]